MREGIRGHEDVNRTSSGFLAEQILCYQRGFFPPYRGIPTVGTHEANIQCHIILVVGASGATSGCMVTVKHTLFSGERGMQTKPCLIGAPAVAWLQSNTRSSQERIVADKILSDSDCREGQKTGRNTAVTEFCPYTK
jgi:hypothetical protein